MKNILKPAAALLALNLLLKLAGPAKNILIAHEFGISRKLDAYFIAQNIVDVGLATLTFTVMIVAIPVFAKMLLEPSHRSSAKADIDSFLGQSCALAGMLTVLLLLAAKPLAHVIPGFSNPLSQGYLSGQLALLSLTFLFALPVSVMTGYFHALGRVVMPSVLNALPVLSVILAILLFSGVIGIYSLPAGFLAGSLCVFLLLAGVYRMNTGKFNGQFRNTVVWKKIGNLIAPALIFAAGGHINLLVDQLFTSQIKDGGVSILNYAQFFVTMPFMIIAIPLITALFPEMSKTDALKGPRSLMALTSKSIAVLWILLIPTATTLMSLKTPIIDLFYNHGLFDPGAVEETAHVLLAYGPAILFLSLNNLIQRVFFIKKAFTILMGLTLLSIVLNIGLDFLLASLFSITGIAVATSVTDLLYFAAITALAHRKFGLGFSSRLKKDLAGIIISGLVMGMGLHGFLILFPYQKEASFGLQLLHLGGGLIAGGLIYLGCIKLLLNKGVFTYVSEEPE